MQSAAYVADQGCEVAPAQCRERLVGGGRHSGPKNDVQGGTDGTQTKKTQREAVLSFPDSAWRPL